jgi:hypothetical protein
MYRWVCKWCHHSVEFGTVSKQQVSHLPMSKHPEILPLAQVRGHPLNPVVSCAVLERAWEGLFDWKVLGSLYFSGVPCFRYPHTSSPRLALCGPLSDL